MIVRSIGLSAFGIFIFGVTISITIYMLATAVTTPTILVTQQYAIQCGERIIGNLSYPDTASFNFTNLKQQNVTVTNCGSDFDTVMYLKDSEGKKIQDQATNECDGDDCYVPNYCTELYRQTFTMNLLAPGTYNVELGVHHESSDDTFVVEVMCSSTATDNSSLAHQFEIECGETITGNLSYPDTASFTFNNSQHREVVITNCGSELEYTNNYGEQYGIGTTMFLKNSSGVYIYNGSTNNCYGDNCVGAWVCREYHSETFVMNTLSPGQYTIEFVPEYDEMYGGNGTFMVQMLCPQWRHGSIECGQHLTVTTTNNTNDYLYLNFTTTRPQQVSFVICSDFVRQHLSLQDPNGNYFRLLSYLTSRQENCDKWSARYNISLSGGQYQLIFPLDSLTLTAFCSPLEWINISCGQPMSGNMSEERIIYFNFNNARQQDVTFTDCDSNLYGSTLKLRDSTGTYIQQQSRHQCDGHECYDENYVCKTDLRETFTMEMLDVGQYTMELTADSDDDTFDVEILCNSSVEQKHSMECGDVINGTMTTAEIVRIGFINTMKQDVLFTNCGSDWRVDHLYLRNAAGTLVQNQSTNHCDGDDCFFAGGYCQDEYAETFLMKGLQMGEYTIEFRDDNYQWRIPPYRYSVEVICNPVLCDDYEYTWNMSEVHSNFVYKCHHRLESTESLYVEFCSGDSNVNILEMKQIQESYGFVKDMGLGIDSNILLLSLLFVNVSSAIFIIFGLKQLPLDIDINTISSIIVVTQLLLITAFLSFDQGQFGSCSMRFGQLETDFAPTLFHFATVMLGSILHFAWFHWTPCVCSACKYCGDCKYFACFSLIILLLTYWLIMPSGGWSTMFGSKMPDLIMTFFCLFFQSLLPLYLSKLTPRCDCLCKRQRCRFILCISMLLSFTITFTLLVRFFVWDRFHTRLSFCSVIGGISWANPFFLFCSLFLLFSEFWTLIIFHNAILLIIFLTKFLSNSVYFCSAVVNVQYIVHSFLIPIYIFLLFKSLPPLRSLSTSLFGIYLTAFDLFSDFVVVFYFIVEEEPIFAFLQLMFIITGQVVGAISDVFGSDHGSYSVIDKVMAVTGFGRIWFTVNWWKESITQDGTGKYEVLRRRHKIWDLLYEAFPTVALQIYAAMTTDVPVLALVVSIMISAVSVSFSTTMYLRDLLKVATTPKQTTAGVAPQHDDDDDNNLNESTRTLSVLPDTLSSSNSMISSPKRDSPRDESKQMYFALFVFMASDFYIRSIPMVMVLAMIANTHFGDVDTEDSVWRSVTGVILFGVVAIFEFFANQNIRISSHRDFGFILKIFVGSIFSSFHTMLSTLSVLKMDPFYAESVIFSKYMVEHGIRCVFALIFCIYSLALSDSVLWFPWALTPVFVALVVINGRAMRWIYNSNFIAPDPKSIELSPMMSVEKHKVQSVDDDDDTFESDRSQSEEEKTQIDSLKQDEDDDGALENIWKDTEPDDH